MSDETMTSDRLRMVGTETVDTVDTTLDDSVALPKKYERKGTARWLFGSLGVAGVQHVKVNFGLLRIECECCDGKEVVDEDNTFHAFRAQVQEFAKTHADCRVAR